MTTVKFVAEAEPSLKKELRSRVNAYFKENKLQPSANQAMVIKTIALLLLYFVPYTLILLNIFNVWVMLLLTVVMGIGSAGIGMGVMHDANHNAYFSKSKFNNWLGYSMNLIGGNRFNWIIQHNIKHHTFTNIYGMDEDLDNGEVIRLSPHSQFKWYHRFQHIYAWFLYMFGTLSWVTIKDFKQMVHLQRQGNTKLKGSNFKKELAILIFSKLFYYLYLFVIPLLVLDLAFWQILIGFVVIHFVSGFILSVTFQLAHIVEGTDHENSSLKNEMENSWTIHQIRTTADFARKSNILNWYLGGLNFQIEHHLFPHVCHIHYKNLSEIVKKTVQEFGLTYNEQTSMLKAIRSHYLTLKAYSKPAIA